MTWDQNYYYFKLPSPYGAPCALNNLVLLDGALYPPGYFDTSINSSGYNLLFESPDDKFSNLGAIFTQTMPLVEAGEK